MGGKLSMFYVLVASTVLGVYAGAAMLGWEPGTLARESAQQSTARHAAGGHRAAWIGWFRMGK